MLDQDTKRKIDNARDILVGKIPDPKSQVEQITISLIYKFMDDMDLESIEMGGVASFFTGDYQKYAWSKIFDRSLSGFELTNLYSEAIIKMNQNPNIPQLFRDIFKNAYLPYRDPETLRAFLKEINGFHYDHSERLGDAFEYLLSVLGSQGDAGQFRTPRHIIDFIVQVVNPQKNQTVLDPACGTAGFLISSYKNILAENTRDKRGDLLTPAERQRLMRNFAGYDISPDMVRLSLVNLYLHGFPDPIIHEYDTLTSEERWNETYDVILANPPFMTPKGGIRPHKRFSVQANRSEVLFVDYIAEHLNPGGRAGVIVPEGIIFQSQNAYKKLRKMLVENYLYAVVSLPAGVFQPYSGVKTSILLMDKTLSKRTDKILFVKIENDGYDPGAQRRPIDKNDLPKALEFLHDYRKALLNNEALENTDYAHIVGKSKIEESGDWNLSGERYKKNKIKTSHFEIINLREVAKIGSGNSAPQDNKYFINGKYPFFRTSDVGKVHISTDIQISRDYVNQKAVDELKLKLFPQKTILFPKSGASTFLNHRVILGIEGYVSSHLATIIANNDKILPHFLFYLLCGIDANNLTENQNYPSLRLADIETIKIPLPPLEVQQEIIAEIDGYQKIIDGARQVVENYKPTIKIDPDWEVVELGEVIDFVSGLTLSIPKSESEDGVPIISMNSIDADGVISYEGIRTIELPKKKTINYCQKGDLLFNWRNGSKHLVGKTGYFDFEGKYVFASFLLGIRVKPESLISKFLWYMLNNYRKEGRYLQFMRMNVNGLFNRKELKILKILLPPLSIQQEIVARIEEEQKLVEANKRLIEIYEQKIKDKIGEVWGE